MLYYIYKDKERSLLVDARREMKQLRDWVRSLVSRTKNDPFLADLDVANRLEVRFVKWNKRGHEVLVCVRDLRQPETYWNSSGTRWSWVRTGSQHNRYAIWKEINDVVCNMRHPDRLPF